LPHVPVVIGLLLVEKGYLVEIEAVPEEALSASFSNWPAHLLPVFVGMMFGATLGGKHGIGRLDLVENRFVGMMFGATLGGNATVIGAAGNVVAAGIAAKAGHPIGFMRFLRIGLPLTLAQLVASTLCILWMLR
ncbi:MAG: hypothetical protein ACKOUS_20460, partial [Alphaproteobacteria bacterium]